MAVYPRDSSVFRQSVWRVSCGDSVVRGCHTGGRSDLHRRLAAVRMGSLERYDTSDNGESHIITVRREMEGGTHYEQRRVILLGRAASRSLSTDRSPSSLGVDEGSFETLSFFVKLQTIFFDT